MENGMTPVGLRILSLILFLAGIEWSLTVWTGPCACPAGVVCQCPSPFAWAVLLYLGIAMMAASAIHWL